VEIRVDDTGAAYPIVIDPIYSRARNPIAELETLFPKQAKTIFGRSEKSQAFRALLDGAGFVPAKPARAFPAAAPVYTLPTSGAHPIDFRFDGADAFDIGVQEVGIGK